MYPTSTAVTGRAGSSKSYPLDVPSVELRASIIYIAFAELSACGF